MNLKCAETIGVFGYIIVANNEIHSRQICLLNFALSQYEIEDDGRIIKDILDDKDDKITYDDCINAFEQEDTETKQIVYGICFRLAIADNDNAATNTPDSKEEDILRKLETCMDKSGISSIRSQGIEEIRKFNFANASNSKNSFNIDFNSLLSVASKDYDTYKTVFYKIFDSCKIMQTRLQTKLDNIQAPLLKTALEGFLCDYKDDVLSALSDLKDSSLKKELAAQNFSIALMGRTKAGKSTLHYIMCNDGEEFIGKGSQRTTRFNRVFNWEQLKIIDTPGIGAGEEDGKKDEEIALSVLSQADIVCFVVIDDTIQNDVLDLLNRIAEYHKPLLVVLNHKEDIRKKSHFKTFLNNPDDWRVTTGESNLNGYINRLNRNAEKNNYDKLMKVVPVFLLAAQIGMEKNDEQILKASNYQAFLDAMRSLVSENNVMYKSQTMLDEPSIRLHKVFSAFEKENEKLCVLQQKVKNIKKAVLNKTDSFRRNVLLYSESSITAEFDDFVTAKSYDYAEENFKVKSVFTLNNSFNEYLEGYCVKQHIDDKVSAYIEDYHNAITEIISELDDELKYAKLNTENLFNANGAAIDKIEKIRGTFSLHGIFKVASWVLDVAGIFWAPLAVVSVPVSLVGNLFKPKKEKIKNAKDLALENFKNLADYNKNNAIKRLRMTLEQLFKEDKEQMTSFFGELEAQLDETISFVSSCSLEFKNGIKSLDKVLAKRILQYIANNPDDYVVEKAERNLAENTFKIYVRQTNPRGKIEVDKYRKISTEKIRIIL